MNEWKTIESAPKNRPILIWTGEGIEVGMGTYDLFETWSNYHGREFMDALMWMELPDPPLN